MKGKTIENIGKQSLGILTIIIVLAALTGITGATSEIEPGKFYSVVNAGAINRLISIDPVTVQVETITYLNLDVPETFRSNSLAFHPDGRLFGWDNKLGQLYQINTETGDLTHIGTATGTKWINGLAFDKGGTLYGSQGPGNLYSVDLTTSALTLIGGFGESIRHNGLAINFQTDELYLISGLGTDYDKVLKINKNTGHATNIGSLGGTTPLSYGGVGVEFKPCTGELYTLRKSNILWKFNINTGIATEIGSNSEFYTTNMASPWPSPTTCTTLPPGGEEIPEFPTAALPAIIATGGYLLIRKKREQ